MCIRKNKIIKIRTKVRDGRFEVGDICNIKWSQLLEIQIESHTPQIRLDPILAIHFFHFHLSVSIIFNFGSKNIVLESSGRVHKK